jgi:glycosyltransferase involved in cell wall biosynthesis
MGTLRVCIVGLKCFDQIAGKQLTRYLGGIETQLVALAKGLYQENCDVSLITYDHGQAEVERFGGVTVYKSYPPAGGTRGVRMISRALRFWQAMRRANADIYLQMGAGGETGMTALGCRLDRRRARKFVYCLASDSDCAGPVTVGTLGWEYIVYHYGLKHAQLIVAQTRKQQESLSPSSRQKSQVIPMAVSSGVINDARHDRRNGSNDVLWIGRIVPEKRLEWLLEAARRCHEISFHVVGMPNKASKYAETLLHAAKTLSNVKVHGRLSVDELGKLYQNCRLLSCTSTLEGFPTTFLEAWSYGMPVVTTFDPDQLVARRGLGRVVATVDELVSDIRNLVSDGEAYATLCRATQNYFSRHHTIDEISRRFRSAFEQFLN